MGLREAIPEYREPNGMVSIYRHPAPRSTDNGLLFSATYLVLLGKELTGADTAWFFDLATKCEIEPGLLARFPGEKEPTSHDDLTGVASIGWVMASRIMTYLSAHAGAYPGQYTFARIPDFFPALQRKAGRSLSLPDQLSFCMALLWNCFEKKASTSGKCLIYLKQKMILGAYPLCDFTSAIWRIIMKLRYPGGMSDVYAIYFGPDHPFAVYGPKDFL